MSGNGFGSATALLLDSHLSADSFRSTLANDSLLGFLALLVLLLAAVLIVVIRLPPYQSAPAEDRQDEAASVEGVPLNAYPQLTVTGSVPAPLGSAAGPSGPARLAGPGRSAIPVRVPSQPSQQRGYSARHAPSHGPGHEQDTVSLPKVSGSPPWGPAPRPPGMR